MIALRRAYTISNPKGVSVVSKMEVERLRAQIQTIKRYGVFTTFGKVLCEMVRACRVVLPCLFAWLTVRDWPIHPIQANLTADIKSDLKGKLSIESETVGELLSTILTVQTLIWILVVIALGAVAYGRYQEKLRRDDVERLSRYKEMYEKIKDPHRSSSRLTPRGETRPEDE